MSAGVGHESIARKPLWRRRQFWHVALPVLAGASVLIAGILVLDAFVGSNGVGRTTKGWGVTYPVPVKPKTVKLEPAAETVTRLFIRTAVARKNLRSAYAIAGPHVREGMTLKAWLTGAIPVVPYKVTAATGARMAIDYSYKNQARLEVYITTPGQKGRVFFVNLIKTQGSWFVDGWVPRGAPAIPTI